MMKNFILTLTLLLIVPILEAQNKSIYFSIAMPSECTLDNNTKSLLKNKFFNLLSKEGVASMEYGAIAMIPEVNVNNSSKIAGGMRNIYSVELNITVTVRNIITNTVFNTLQIACNGEGYTEREAQRSAINRIDLSSPTYTKFIEMTKSKIETHYFIKGTQPTKVSSINYNINNKHDTNTQNKNNIDNSILESLLR